MRVLGAAALCAEGIAEEVREANFAGRALVVVSDGQDVMAIFGEEGDTSKDVMTQARRFMPELAE